MKAMINPIAGCHAKATPIRKAMMLSKTWPINEHQNAVLKEN